MMRQLSILFLLLFALPCFAATFTANSVSLVDVSNAVHSASAGDTVIIPAGSATWPATLDITKVISIIGSGTNVTLAWSPSPGAKSYNIYTNSVGSNLVRVLSTVPTNATFSNVPVQKLVYYGAAAVSSSGTSDLAIISYMVDTNVYETNYIYQPWYQEQYGPKLTGTNWANRGTPFAGQFTNLPSAFLRFKWLSNQVNGFTILTNPPPDTNTMLAMSNMMKMIPRTL